MPKPAALLCPLCHSDDVQRKGKTPSGSLRIHCNACHKYPSIPQDAQPESPEDALKHEREKRKRLEERAGNRGLIKLLEAELKESKERTRFLDRMAALPNPKPFHVRKKRGNGVPEASYVMLASDWHVGERVRPEAADWRNEYNPEIAEERAERFFQKNLMMLDVARKGWKIDQAVFWLGGDLITGYIHEEYQEDNFLSPTEESLLAMKLIRRGIDFLLKESDLRHILVPTNHGNHGRSTAKKRSSNSHLNSFEWMLYRLLEDHYADEDRVTFQVANGYHNVVDLYGVKIRFHHGDELTYNSGVGGITVPLYRRIGRQAAGGQLVDLDVIGHFHQLGFPKLAVTNGSLIGWNAYAENKGLGYEPAQQGSFVVDAKYRVFSAMNPILVER